MTTRPVAEPALLAYWRPIVTAFDPRRALLPDEVEDLYVTRPRSASDRILEELQFANNNGSLFLLCGSRGSGKTTELARIHHILQDERLLLFIDLQSALPSPLSSVSLVIVLGFNGLRLIEQWKQGADKELKKEFQQAIDELAPKKSSSRVLDVGKILEGMGTTVAAAGILFAAPPTAIMGGTAAALAKGLQLHWNPEAGRVALDAPEGARLKLAGVVNRIFKRLQELCGRPVLLLADGLDKLSDQQQLMQVLNDPRLLAELGVAIVLTGPINLLHSTEFNALRNIATPAPLYNPVVYNFTGQEKGLPPGIELLERLVARRRARYELPTEWIGDDEIRDLAVGSGGSVRDFVELVRNASKSASTSGSRTIMKEQVRNAIKDLRHFLQLPLNEHSVHQLQLVLRTRRPTSDPHCEELLFNNYILCYPNGDLWYRPHEALVPWLESQKTDSGAGT